MPQGTPRHVAVIDIGKSNAKLALVETEGFAEVAVLTRPNRVLPGPPWPHFDTEGHWAFLVDGLRRLRAEHGIDAITATAHGACAALLAADGGLAAPVLDYEHAGPDEVAAEYDAIRPGFEETGSPRLNHGLNLGAQLHWQFAVDPGLRERVAQVVTWPQYWTYRLTGVAASEVSSLGAHTDLWEPEGRRFSALFGRLGLAGRIAQPRPASDVLGPVLPEIAAATGLPPDTPVHCGIHDSNASLLPHLLGREAPFAVVSTGTWVISMAVGGRKVRLDPDLDTLVNVSAFGEPVPSARFMGGREFEMILGGNVVEPGPADYAEVLSGEVMLLPAVLPDCGPFAGHPARWTPGEPERGTGLRSAVAGFYLALVTARSLSLIGREGPVIVEGPLAHNRCYREMLAAATGAPVIASGTATGTSQGAALLAVPGAVPRLDQTPAAVPSQPERMHSYAQEWMRIALGAQR